MSLLHRIMGLYASVVLVIGKFVREFFSGISHTIMFEELPNVDRILKLCTDIFLVRETGELDLEEDMYAKLIFLYRSPETMIKWTREKTQWNWPQCGHPPPPGWDTLRSWEAAEHPRTKFVLFIWALTAAKQWERHSLTPLWLKNWSFLLFIY